MNKTSINSHIHGFVWTYISLWKENKTSKHAIGRSYMLSVFSFVRSHQTNYGSGTLAHDCNSNYLGSTDGDLEDLGFRPASLSPLAKKLERSLLNKACCTPAIVAFLVPLGRRFTVGSRPWEKIQDPVWKMTNAKKVWSMDQW
jgi:hypothetical protein